MQMRLLALALGVGALFAAEAADPASALWIGGGDRAVITDPANWQCFDDGGRNLEGEIPSASTTAVTVEGETTFNCPPGQPVIWKSLSIGSVTLTADCDWRGAGRTSLIAANSTVNLKGHNLAVQAVAGTPHGKVIFTDDSAAGEGGALTFEVAAGERFENMVGWNKTAIYNFAGSLKLVKDGAGTFKVAYPASDTNLKFYRQTGGLTIHAGTVEMNKDNPPQWEASRKSNELYYKQTTRPELAAAGAPVVIEADGTLDYFGVYELSVYNLFINGGTLKSTVDVVYPEEGTNGAITFGADSSFDFDAIAHVGGPFLLNGHTLAIDIAAEKTYYCRAGEMVNGTVVVTGAGVFRPWGATPLVATDNVTLDIATPIYMEQALDVANYTARSTGVTHEGTAALRVHGTFTPAGDAFYPAVLQDGATIDLSEKTGVWSTTGTAGTLAIAPGARITLDVGARAVANGEQLLAWTEQPEGVMFRVVGSSIATCELADVTATGVAYRQDEASGIIDAHWTGAGAKGDFADPANWCATNLANEAVQGGVPAELAAVHFNTVSFDIADEAAFYAQMASNYRTFHLGPAITLASDCDWRGIDLAGTLLEGATIDLNGYTLQLAGFDGETTKAFTVTNTAEAVGTLVFDVPAEKTFRNTAITLAGNVRLVKAGAGSFVPNLYNLAYTGGTVVGGGLLKLFNDDGADSSAYAFGQVHHPDPLGTQGSLITIETGATFDLNGIYDLKVYDMCLAGGTLANSKKQTKTTWGGLTRQMTVTVDSAFDFANSTVISDGALDLQGHTLTIDLAKDARLYRKTLTAANGTLKLTGEGWFDTHSGTFEAKTVTFDVGCPMMLNNADVNALNYTARYTGTQDDGTGYMNVFGVFKPLAAGFHAVRLQPGSKIDLSELSAAWSIEKAPFGQLAFDGEMTEAVIDVGARELAAGEQLIAWKAIPEGITFKLIGEKLAETDTLTSAATGLFYNVDPASRVVVSARWTGAAHDGDRTNPANWADCTNPLGAAVADGVPGSAAAVVLGGSLDLSFPADAELPWQRLAIESCTLGADVDLRGLGVYTSVITAESTIDLNGHKLFVLAPAGENTTAYAVTDTSTGTPGEFHLTVAEGATFSNVGTALTGNLRLVKEGAGTFISRKYTQTYTGGTEIAEGTVRYYNDQNDGNSTYALGQKNPNPLGAHGCEVRIDEGAMLDINGIYDTFRMKMVLNGGTLRNSKDQAKYTWGAMGGFTLAADSTLDLTAKTVLNNGDGIDLGGHTLTVTAAAGKTGYLCGIKSLTNGTIKYTTGGWLQIYTALDARTVDFDVNGAFDVKSALSVKDYTARYAYDYSAGTADLNVYGTFTPVSDFFYGCTLQNGATIDLAAKTETWSVTSAFTAGRTTVSFADNATIKVVLGERTFAFTEKGGAAKIIAWETQPKNVQFDVDAPSYTKGRRLTSREDGLYLLKSGLTIFFY